MEEKILIPCQCLILLPMYPSLTLGPPHISIIKSGSNKGLYILAGKPGSAEAVLIRAGKILIGKKLSKKDVKRK